MALAEVNKSVLRPLGLVACSFGIIQGLAYMVFALLCIMCYAAIIDSTFTGQHYYEFIYEFYFRSGNEFSDLIVVPQTFFVFMWFYFFLSQIWFIVSSWLTWTIVNDKWNITHYLFGAWGCSTVAVCILDLILTSLVAADYQFISDHPSPVMQTEMQVSVGIVMSMAAKGYILWVVNLVLAGFMIKYGWDLMKSSKSGTTSPIIYGYDTASIAPPWQESSKNPLSTPGHPSSANYGHNNGGFVADESDLNKSPDFERNNSFYPAVLPPVVAGAPSNKNLAQQPAQNNNFYYSPPISSNASNLHNSSKNVKQNEAKQQKTPDTDRTAKIGKQGRRSPLSNVAPPVVPPLIPDPDYTPPGTPSTGLKSVLRSKTHY